jgi:hypothetical protein
MASSTIEEELSLRLHVFVTPAARKIIDALSFKTGMPRAELARRAMEFAITHMTDQDWQTPTSMMRLIRPTGRPRSRKNGHK